MNYCKQDLGIEPKNMTGKQIVAHLDKRIQDVLQEITTSELWQFLTNKDNNPEQVKKVVKEIYLEIVMYQPDVIEATIAIIGQFPRTVPATTIANMLHHQAEEFDHGEMALKDYIALGGNEEEARNRRMSPTAFSISAMWSFLKHKRDPFAYLGALYPFEGLTPIVSGIIKTHLREIGMSRDTLNFVDYHSTADIEHTDLVKEMIEEIADTFPESKESICYGLEYFLNVYPLRAWEAGYKRVLAEELCKV